MILWCFFKLDSFFPLQVFVSITWMEITKTALGLSSTMKPTSSISQRRTTIQSRTPSGASCTGPLKLTVFPLCSRLITKHCCETLSVMIAPSRSSGTSDTKDMCRSRAQKHAKPQFCAFYEVDVPMSWTSVTVSMVLEEAWLRLQEKLFVDLIKV